MAIRERKGRARPFQVYWNNPFTGKREAANFATKEEALKEDSLIKHRLKFERESFRHEEETEKQKESEELTLEQVYFLYLQEKQFSKKSMAWQLDGMRLPLTLYGHFAISAIGMNEIKEIINQVQSLPIKQVTRHNRLSILRTVLNWSAEKGFSNPVRFPKIDHGHYEKLIPPTIDEIHIMLEFAPMHIQRVIILGLQCGIRIGPSELFKMTWKDIDFATGIIRVQAAHKNPAAPWREIPIRTSIREILQEWHNADRQKNIDYLIHFNGKPISSIKRAWANMLKNSGISRRIRPYDLRHAFATELIAQGVDIGTVAKLMGHSSPNMIFQHYQFVLDKQKKAAVEQLPEIPYVSKNMCPNKKGITEIQ